MAVPPHATKTLDMEFYGAHGAAAFTSINGSVVPGVNLSPVGPVFLSTDPHDHVGSEVLMPIPD